MNQTEFIKSFQNYLQGLKMEQAVNDRIISGKYYPVEKKGDFNKICSIIRISTDTSIHNWQTKIASQIFNEWLELSDNKKKK